MSSLVNVNGQPWGLDSISWDSIATGTYTLISNPTTNFASLNLQNFGSSNKAAIGTTAGRYAYFQEGSLQLVIVPEPAAIALAGIGIAAAAWVIRRRR